jgi:hypothetical protein
MAGLLLKIFSNRVVVSYLVEVFAKSVQKPEKLKPILVEIKTLRDAANQLIEKLETPW